MLLICSSNLLNPGPKHALIMSLDMPKTLQVIELAKIWSSVKYLITTFFISDLNIWKKDEYTRIGYTHVASHATIR